MSRFPAMRVRALAFALLWSAAAFADQPLTDAKVYLSGDGVRAVTASAGGERCVLMVSGLEGELDGLVLDCRVRREDGRTSYLVRFHGSEQLALRSEVTGKASLARGEAVLEYSDAESKKEGLAALWAKHQSQQAAGKLAAASEFDRAKEVALRSRELADLMEPLNRACGTKFTVTIDFSAIADEAMISSRAHQGCRLAIETIEGLCKWKIARATFAEKLSELRCTLGDARDPAFTLSGKSLVVTYSPETVSMEGSLDRYLKEAL